MSRSSVCLSRLCHIGFTFILFVGNVPCYNVEVSKVGVSRGAAGTQFGYSVAIVDSKDIHAKMLLVGAPNLTYNGVEGHGQISGCAKPTDQNMSCNWLNIIDISNLCGKLSRKTETDCAMDSRLGATMKVNKKYPTVRNDTSIPMVLACAPGWKNVFPETDPDRYQNYMIGMCLKIKDNLKPMECTRESCWPFWPRQFTTSLYGRPVFTYAQAGLAAVFTLDGRSEIIAAPGASDWRGAFKVIQNGWLEKMDYSQAKTIYFGYAITTAKFKGTSEYIVSGSPNWNLPPKYGHYGRAEVFLHDDNVASIIYGAPKSCTGYPLVNLRDTIDISQMGTKFGASLEAIDLTGDGFDELLIGAPLYTGGRPEEGRVFVYTTTTLAHSDKMAICGPIGILSGGANVPLLQKKTSFARFGSAIASAGDLDHDGFYDIAIGAPYEDDGSGAVYIYPGHGECDCKMEDVFSQRIAGKNVDTGIRSFGWSIYGNEDIDNNSFPDLAVGAYEANTVVMLRTRPVVNVVVKIKMEPNPIPLNGSLLDCSEDKRSLCFNVSVIFIFNAVGPRTADVGEIKLTWTLDSDTVHKSKEGWSRVRFRGTFGQETMNQNVTLSRSGQTFTRNYTIDVNSYRGKPEPKDAWMKVRMEGSYELIPTSGDNFAVLDPILRKDANREIVEYIEFDKKCDSISTCTSNLKLTVEIFMIMDGVTPTRLEEDTVLYVDAANILEVTTDVMNLLNSSYRAYVNGAITALLKRDALANNGIMGASCKNESQHQISTNITCTADSKLDRNENMKIRMYFDISRQRLLPNMNMDKMKKSVHVLFRADQANKDIDENNNIFERTIGVKLKYEIRIEEDLAESDQIRYKADKTSTRMITLTHRYYIINDGPSILPRTFVNITVPLSQSETDVAMIKEMPENCKFRGDESLVQTTAPGVITQETTRHSVQQETDVERRVREASQLSESDRGIGEEPTETPNGKTITCKTYNCAIIVCEIINLEKTKNGKQETIDIKIEVYEKELAKEKDVREVRYATKATATDPVIWYGEKVVSWKTNVYAEKRTTFVVEPTSVVSEVSIWIIIGSIVGAVIILVIVIIILWKCGFFVRKKHDQAQHWKNASLYENVGWRETNAQRHGRQRS